MSYFREITDDDGNVTYEKVEDVDVLSSLEIPDDVVYNHTAYQKAVDESVKRRKKITELQEELAALASVDDLPETEGEGVDTNTPANEPATPLDKDALYQEFRQRLVQEQQAEAAAAAERQTTLKGILKEHKLPDEMLSVLEHADNPQVVAEALAKSSYRFDDYVSGGEGNSTSLENTFASALKALDLGD